MQSPIINNRFYSWMFIVRYAKPVLSENMCRSLLVLETKLGELTRTLNNGQGRIEILTDDLNEMTA